MNQLSDVAAERAVLAGICQFGLEVYSDISDMITVNSFTFESNQIIYKCLTSLLEKNEVKMVDIPSIWSAAKDLGFAHILDKPDEKTYLRALINFPVRKENLRRLAGKIKKLEIARQLRNELEVARENLNDITGDESIDKIIGLAENPLVEFSTRLGNNSSEAPQLISSGINDYVQYLKDNKRDVVGLSTGLPHFDMAIGGGLRRKTINLIGARSGVGKTFLADNIGLHVADKLNTPVLNLDTEMGQEDHQIRMLANLANVTIKNIETGKFSSNVEESRRVDQAAKKLKEIPYFYKSIAGLPFEDTVAIMRRWVTKTVGMEDSGQANNCLIIYDYLKLMDATNLSANLQEYQALGFQITGLHNFMVRYSTPCLAFIQLNRDGITKEDASVASGSDRQIWLCSNFSIYKEKTPEESNEDGGGSKYNRKMVPVKQRHGEGLAQGDYINMEFDGKYGRIIEGKTRKELKDNPAKSKGEILDDTIIIPEEARQF